MKNSIKYIVSLAVLAVLIVVGGCKEEDVLPSVKIGELSEESIFQGQQVSMTGEGFDQVMYLFLGKQQLEYTLDGKTITFTVPDNFPAGATTITLAMRGGVRETHPFEVIVKPSPVINTFTAFVPVGENITVTGTQLDNNTTVTVDGISATIVNVSSTELEVTVPEGVNENGPISFEITTDYGSISPTTPFYAKQNLIKNSQFNEGEGAAFTDWEIVNAQNDSEISEVTGSNAYGGIGRSMRIVGAGAGAGSQWTTQIGSSFTPLVFGETYTVVLWAKAEAPGASMRVSVSQYDGSGADYFYGADQELSTVWQQYTWTFEVTNDLPEHRVMLDMGLTNVPFVIDYVALVPGTVGAGGAPDVLADGGFENGLEGAEAGWTILNGAATITTTEVYCGAQALEATGVGGNHWDVQLAANAVPLEVGTQYELGFWAKAAGPDGVMRASVSRHASGQSDDFFYSPDITVAEDWSYYSFVFTAQATSTGDHQVVLDFGSTSQTFYVDNVSLREYTPMESLYANGGFEDGLNDWEMLNGTVETTTDEAYEGSSSLVATGTGGNHWDVQLAAAAVTLEEGSMYQLSFWAKAAGPDGVMRASVSRHASGQSDDFFYTPDITVGEDWTYYTYVFTAQATSTGNHQVVLDFGSTTQTFYVDELRVHKFDMACDD